MARRRSKATAALLRGVYEENLGLSNPSRRIPTPEKPRSSWGQRLFLAGALVVAMFGGIGRSSTPSAPQPVFEPDARIAQQFGAEDDPWFQLSASADESLASVYGLAVKTIVLDPGHGGHDPGAIGPSGLTEKAVALDVTRRLARQLSASGFQVHLTRSADVSLTIKQRVDFWVDQGADLFLSVHVNALPLEASPVIETFYFSPRGSQATERLALRENANSGFTVADWRSRVGALASTVKQEESRRLAESLQHSLLTFVRRVNPDVEDWGVKGGPFAVLSDRWRHEGSPAAFAAPSALVEIAVISHMQDETRLKTDVFREGVANALFKGIIRFASSDTAAAEKPDTLGHPGTVADLTGGEGTPARPGSR